ncbi:MAG: hypothetical protein PHH85_05235 [Candidatus Methanoperedens sp.]|nr:hypothetical protein [Candidatus Methanoperedens sp.]
MSHSEPGFKEGILIMILGITGIIKVINNFEDAGEMITRMLYTLIFIFVSITLIGIKIIKDARKW